MTNNETSLDGCCDRCQFHLRHRSRGYLLIFPVRLICFASIILCRLSEQARDHMARVTSIGMPRKAFVPSATEKSPTPENDDAGPSSIPENKETATPEAKKRKRRGTRGKDPNTIRDEKGRREGSSWSRDADIASVSIPSCTQTRADDSQDGPSYLPSTPSPDAISGCPRSIPRQHASLADRSGTRRETVRMSCSPLLVDRVV